MASSISNTHTCTCCTCYINSALWTTLQRCLANILVCVRTKTYTDSDLGSWLKYRLMIKTQNWITELQNLGFWTSLYQLKICKHSNKERNLILANFTSAKQILIGIRGLFAPEMCWNMADRIFQFLTSIYFTARRPHMI